MRKNKCDVVEYTPAQIESERDRMIQGVMKAIVAGLSSSGGATFALTAIEKLTVKSRVQEQHLRGLKKAANLALDEIYAFFAGLDRLDMSFAEVMEAFDQRKKLDELVVRKIIKEATKTWPVSGHIGS